MNLSPRRLFCCSAIVCAAGAIATTWAEPTNSDLATAYNQAMAEFQSAKYAQAAAHLETLTARIEASPQVEPIFYSAGSAYFNAGDYTKAISAFKTYLAKFPQGTHASEAAFAIAQSNLLLKNFADAAAQMAALERDPKMREQALLAEAEALKATGKIGDAIRTLEKLIGDEIRTPETMRGATLMAQLLAQKGDGAAALRTLERIHQKIALADNVIELNALTVDLGDKFFDKQQYQEALACYRKARPREQVVRLQNERCAEMERRIERNLAAARAKPAAFTQLMAANRELKEQVANAQKLMTDFDKLPSITPAIYLRLARCFYELDRKWEAVVVNEEILDRFKGEAEREPALFGLIVGLADINQAERAQEPGQQYLSEFKDGPNITTVSYLLGACALQTGDLKTAETHFAHILDEQPKSPFREQVRYLLANAKFAAGSYPDAIAAYKKYLNEFPKGTNAEEAKYRITLCALFGGKYEEAMHELTDYIAKHPDAPFLPDAKYRLTVCQYAASLYGEVIVACQAWEKQFPQNAQLAEVLALLGDAYAASEQESEAVSAYIRSYKTATTEDVMNYSLFAAGKILQKRAQWDRIGQLFGGFIEEKPDNPTVVSALYWLGKAKAHEGKIDEAKQLAAEAINKYVADPRRDTVEQLITQFAQFCVKNKKLAEPATNRETAAQPGASLEDSDAELDRLLSCSGNLGSATARARILFARAELARLQHQPAEEEKNIAQIGNNFKPQDLSPLLLGKVGDYFLGRGRGDQAAEFYQQLLDDFPKSQMVDFAYFGLGEIARQKKDYRRALRFFSAGTEKAAAGQKLKNLSLGRAQTLFALGQLDEAQKAFEQVASVREWRGEATACSVYSLGQIAARRGKWAEANAYFQRVYVGYQKFLPWVAKAYIGSAESFEKLGKKEEASNTYREMLRNEKLANFSETAEARQRLQALGEG
jgi:TolA-binding protein